MSVNRARLVRIARTVLVLLVLVAAAYAVVRHWREVSSTVTHLSWRAWLPGFFILPVAIGCSTMSWQVLVDELGEPIGARRGAQIFLVGQLGKYVPGSVWAYLLQLELGRRAGVARARIFAATVCSLAVVVVALSGSGAGGASASSASSAATAGSAGSVVDNSGAGLTAAKRSGSIQTRSAIGRPPSLLLTRCTPRTVASCGCALRDSQSVSSDRLRSGDVKLT
jgi:hypothetical protein